MIKDHHVAGIQFNFLIFKEGAYEAGGAITRKVKM